MATADAERGALRSWRSCWLPPFPIKIVRALHSPILHARRPPTLGARRRSLLRLCRFPIPASPSRPSHVSRRARGLDYRVLSPRSAHAPLRRWLCGRLQVQLFDHCGRKSVLAGATGGDDRGRALTDSNSLSGIRVHVEKICVSRLYLQAYNCFRTKKIEGCALSLHSLSPSVASLEPSNHNSRCRL